MYFNFCILFFISVFFISVNFKCQIKWNEIEIEIKWNRIKWNIDFFSKCYNNSEATIDVKVCSLWWVTLYIMIKRIWVIQRHYSGFLFLFLFFFFFFFLIIILILLSLLFNIIHQNTDCDDIVCLNGGFCLPISSNPERTWTCECPNSYFGDICQNTNPCLTNPEIWCINGTCADISGRNFTCECDLGFEGPRCSNFNPCVSNPCEAGDVCEYLWDNNYRCKCSNLGFYGRYCEKYNNCTANPCQNDGICTHLGDKTFICDCDTENTGYYGDLCELYDPCYKFNPCQNSGNCSYSEEGKFFTCTCPAGFDGSLCQFVDICHRDRPCLNQGTCTPLIKDPPEYECHCERGYLGKNCEIAGKLYFCCKIFIIIVIKNN